MNRLELKNLCRFYRRLNTLGINGLSQEEFILKLDQFLTQSSFEFCYKQNREKVILGTTVLVVDIRQNPYVKKGFRPDELRNLLEANGHEYFRYKHLGNPFYKQHLQEQNPSKAKEEYQNYVLTDNKAKKEFRGLYSRFRYRKIICLICYCQTEDPLKCHRFWLRELLMVRKRKHIGFDPNFSIQEQIQTKSSEVRS